MRRAIWVQSLVLGLMIGNVVSAQTAVLREAGERLLGAVARYFGKTGAHEVKKQLLKYGGEAFVRRIAERLLREGGEEALEKVVALTGKYGPDVLRAVDHAPSPKTLLSAIDELPAEQVKLAVKRLSAGAQGKALAQLVERYGASALRVEIAHPGVGVRLMQHLGDDGVRLAPRLDPNDAITVARHVEDIAALPADQKSSVLRLLYDDTRRMVQFMGRFVEKNPGKTLFTVATTTVFLANADRILGGDDIVFNENGNPIVVHRPGFLEIILRHLTDNLVRPIVLAVTVVLALGLTGWIGLKLLYAYRLHRVKDR